MVDEPEQGEPGAERVVDPKVSKTLPSSKTEADKVGSFSIFYRQSLPTLVAFLMYLGANLSDATDIAQEAMIAAFQSWDIIQHPKPWTRRVASRAFIRQIARVEDPAENLPEHGVLIPDDPVIDLEERNEILRLIRLLPPRQRQVMAWTFDGFKPSEIAAELDLKPEVVRANLRKARIAIAAHLTAAHEESAR
jgi:RNA polymerase sigma factor (sigma-70 family)